jgi:hypothetical protein
MSKAVTSETLEEIEVVGGTPYIDKEQNHIVMPGEGFSRTSEAKEDLEIELKLNGKFEEKTKKALEEER